MSDKSNNQHNTPDDEHFTTLVDITHLSFPSIEALFEAIEMIVVKLPRSSSVAEDCVITFNDGDDE